MAASGALSANNKANQALQTLAITHLPNRIPNATKFNVGAHPLDSPTTYPLLERRENETWYSSEHRRAVRRHNNSSK